jgi:hypothetical protein
MSASGTARAASDQVLAALVSAPRHVNPAVELWLELQQQGPFSAEDLMAASSRIEDAIAQGEAERDATGNALRNLIASQPGPARFVPIGF